MAKAPGFDHDKVTGNIDMNAGDTGSFWVHCSRKSGADWPSTARMLYTIRSGGEIVLQRIYRLDDQWGAGDGWFLFELHNNDTDSWSPGTYETEWRFDVSPTWDGGEAPEGRCVNALTAGVTMNDGAIVRTKVQSTLEILDVLGKI